MSLDERRRRRLRAYNLVGLAVAAVATLGIGLQFLRTEPRDAKLGSTPPPRSSAYLLARSRLTDAFRACGSGDFETCSNELDEAERADPEVATTSDFQALRKEADRAAQREDPRHP